jgi:hypothetical protein
LLEAASMMVETRWFHPLKLWIHSLKYSVYDLVLRSWELLRAYAFCLHVFVWSFKMCG